MNSFLFDKFVRLNEAVSRELLREGEVADAENVVFDSEIGRLVKRGRFSQYNSNKVDPSGTIKTIEDVKDKDGNNYLLIAISTKLRKSLDGTGTWSDVKTGLTSGAKIRLVPYFNRYICFNGEDAPFEISGSAFANVDNLEITRPDVSGVKTQHGIAGSLDDAAQYRWVMCYATDEGELSPPSQPLTHYFVAGSNLDSTDATNLAIYFESLPASTHSRVTKKYIFRTEGSGDILDGGSWRTEGSIYYLEKIIKNDETTFTSVMPDTDLDTSLTIVFLRAPKKAKYGCINNDRLFLANLEVDDLNTLEPPITNNKGSTTSVDVDGTPVTFSDGAEFGWASETTGEASGLTASYYYQWRLEFEDVDGRKSLGVVDSDIKQLGSPGSIHITLNKLPMTSVGSSKELYPGSTRRVLYRTEGSVSLFSPGTKAFKKVADLDVVPGSWWQANNYLDVTPDGSLGATYAIPVTAKVYPSSISFSEISNPSEFNLEDIRNIYPEDGEEISGIFDDGNGVLIWRKNSILKLYTEGSPTNWQLRKLIKNLGCAYPDTLVRDRDTYYFAGISKDNGEGRIYKYEVGREPVLISGGIKDHLLNLVSYYDAVAIDGKYYISLLRSGNSNHLNVFDGETWSKFKTLEVSMNTLGIKKHSNNTLLFDYAQYVGNYNNLTPGSVDSKDTGSTQISVTVTLPTKRVPDGISKGRVRFLEFNYKKRSGQDTLIKIYDADTGTTDTFTDNTGSGWKAYKTSIGNADSNVKKITKLYVMILGSGMDEFGNLRIKYRPVREGVAV